MLQELGLTAILIVLLIAKLMEGEKTSPLLYPLVMVLLLGHLLISFVGNTTGMLFGGMYVNTPLIGMEKGILGLGTLLICLQAGTWLKNHKHSTEFFMLLIATLMGMDYLLSAGNLLMFYLALELSTIPLAALCNFDLEKRRSSESAMKLILSSAFSSGILLFGISMLYGATGSLNFIEISRSFMGTEMEMLALIFIFSGFAFKIAVVPFHFWTADVYEGAPIPVTAFLSVISKGAMIFALTTMLYKVFGAYAAMWYNILFVASAITMTLGNLFAMRQMNIKRFLAFSSITQAGYLLLGLSGASAEGATSVVYFMLVYIFSNLGAFGVLALVSAATGKEEIHDFKGFYKNNPVLSWVFALSLFSLAGIPPTAGFFGKLFLITAGASRFNMPFLVIAALNMVISLFYYLKVVRAMLVEQQDEPLPTIAVPFYARIALVVCVAGVLLTGFFGQIYEYIHTLSLGF